MHIKKYHKIVGLSLFHSLRASSSYKEFTLWNKTHIHLYSFLNATSILAIFLIKAKTSLKYNSYLLTLLQIIEAFTRNSFVFRSIISINLFICSSCNGTKCCLEAAYYCLQPTTHCSYSIFELSSLTVASSS